MKYRQMAKLSPALLLEGATPRLLDEWQLAPTLWDSVRRAVDDRGEPGQFILTGSAVPADRSQIHHSGTGRFSWITMRTMSLWESGDSNGRVCLGDLFRPEVEVAAVNDLKIADIAYLICRGGWPSSTILPRAASLRPVLDYLDALGSVDIDRVGPFPHNPTRVKHLMRSYARHQSTQASFNTISADFASDPVSAIDARTVSAYVDSLKSFFVIEDAPAWNPNLRSRTAIRTSDTRYFTDPSIATAALGIGPKDSTPRPRDHGFAL